MGKVTSDKVYANLLEPVKFRPIFIMGVHRSGTTLLYQLLQATGLFNVATSYHVIQYDELLANHVNHKEQEARQALRNLFRNKGITDRVIDDIVIDADTPEEYGFILRNASLKPYVNDASLPKFIELCKKIQLVSETSRPLLLKNPRDFIRFLYLKDKFPEARFIFLHRDPVDTINSHVNAIRAVFHSQSQYQAIINHSYGRMYANPLRLLYSRLKVSPRYGLDLKRARKQHAEKVDYFLRNIESLPGSSYCSIKFEDLCEKPEHAISDITGFLQLSPAQDVNYGALINKRPTVLLDEVEREKDDIKTSLKTYYEYCGFEKA